MAWNWRTIEVVHVPGADRELLIAANPNRVSLMIGLYTGGMTYYPVPAVGTRGHPLNGGETVQLHYCLLGGVIRAEWRWNDFGADLITVTECEWI